MEVTPTGQPDPRDNCIFCKIIDGKMPGNKVFEDDTIFACLDINPAIRGHLLLMPKEHYPIMPVLPAETFKHLFGLLPKLTRAEQDAMGATGVNVVIANGGAAGQQSPHFLVHLLPREPLDSFNKYMLQGEDELIAHTEALPTLQNNFPIMMNNHFGRQPAKWHKGTGSTPAHLQDIRATQALIYEDELVLVTSSPRPIAPGHMIIYSKEEPQSFERLSEESASHFFYTASFAATMVFEGLQAQGTNIILKSGSADDNPERRLSMHVLPRSMEDGLDVMWKAEPGENLESVASQIAEKAFFISPPPAQEEKILQTVTLGAPERIGESSDKRTDASQEPKTHREEIALAIRRICDR